MISLLQTDPMRFGVKFCDLATGSHFLDDDGDLCQKVDSGNARTPYCASGFVAGFRHGEEIFPAPKCYRIPTESGWMYIGAADERSAARVARQSQLWVKPEGLQVLSGREFVACTPSAAAMNLSA